MSQSEKVCKQLGIRPLIFYYIDGSCEPYSKKEVIQFFNDCKKHKLRRYLNGLRRKIHTVEKIYPDMTQPGNFVKLLEICFSFFERINLRKKDEITYVQAFIDIIIQRCDVSDNNLTEEGLINFAEFKKLIQKTEWNY